MNLLVMAVLSVAGAQASPAGEAGSLELEAKIPLGNVKGWIDHMAVDLAGQRLFVAELGNGSIGIIDLKLVKVVGSISGLKEPQGAGHAATTDTLYVASAGDGSVRLFRGPSLKETGRIDLGEDADNIRIDSESNRVFVGYGRGALAIIDAQSNRKVGDIALNGHPEGFRHEHGGSRIFVNVPDAHAIEVADRESGTVVARWPTGRSRANFPMALDDASRQVLVVFRDPATLTAYAMPDRAQVASAQTCRDADDVFVDAKRRRIYVSCREGYLDIFERSEGNFRRLAHIPTAPEGRTALFVPELDHLFVAVRASGREPAAVWVYRPRPQEGQHSGNKHESARSDIMPLLVVSSAKAVIRSVAPTGEAAPAPPP